MNKIDLQNKKVFVTGADGFIGSHLVEALVRSGARVTALVYYNSWNNIGWLSDISNEVLSEIEILPGDIRDTELMQSAVRHTTVVFHLASLIAIPYSYTATRSYFDTNALGTLNVLRACCDSKSVEMVLHTSTSEVYGSAQFTPMSEDHPIVAQSPYAASKIAADKIAESMHLSFDLPVITARPFNTFGPRQTARAVIPTIASQLVAGLTEIKIGDLSPKRDFNFVEDTVSGMISLIRCEEAIGRTVNIGSGQEHSIGDTLGELKTITGNNAEVVSEPDRIRPAKSEVNRLLADTKLIKSLTNWAPSHTFSEGLQKTVAWISSNLEKFNVDEFSR